MAHYGSSPVVINIDRPDPSKEWGFRLHGGVDFGVPLTLSHVTPNSLSYRHGLRVGDRVLGIGGDPTAGMSHQQAQQAVIRCGNELQVAVIRGDGTVPIVPVMSPVAHQAPHRQVHAPPSSRRQPGSAQFDSNTTDHDGYYSNPAAANFRVHAVVNITGGKSGHKHVPHHQHHQAAPPPQPPVSPFRHIQQHQPAPYSPPPPPKREESPIRVPKTALPAHYAPPQPRAPFMNDEPPRSGRPQPFSPKAYDRNAGPQPYQPAFQAAQPSPKVQPKSSGGKNEPRRVKQGTAQFKTYQPQAGNIPICASCNQSIRGPFIAALEYTFCPDHFTCSHCNCRLENCGFVEDNGRLFCEQDFANLLAPKCEKCHTPVVGSVVTAMSKKWHPGCFVCTHCRTPISEGTFRVGDDSKPYCEKDYRNLFAMHCDKCGGTIDDIDRFLEALGKLYHSECFKCAACQVSLEGKPFVPRDGKAFCKAHARAAALY